MASAGSKLLEKERRYWWLVGEEVTDEVWLERVRNEDARLKILCVVYLYPIKESMDAP